MSRYKTTVRVLCLNADCGETVHVGLDVWHDPGCRYTPNGDGWPEETSWDILGPDQCPGCHTLLDSEQWSEAVDAAFNEADPNGAGYYAGRDTVDEDDR